MDQVGLIQLYNQCLPRYTNAFKGYYFKQKQENLNNFKFRGRICLLSHHFVGTYCYIEDNCFECICIMSDSIIHENISKEYHRFEMLGSGFIAKYQFQLDVVQNSRMSKFILTKSRRKPKNP